MQRLYKGFGFTNILNRTVLERLYHWNVSTTGTSLPRNVSTVERLDDGTSLRWNVLTMERLDDGTS
ncbi:hypothetical protein OGM63_22265 [Plectonema radiosum NIES-515]|uniref:Uncharacterized protein n=1 Tax=Plectonema radiosum NIES-515 TaxID=2986073 RepID=A0ABT3B4A5_9CYAN|nr:hypothetical protein [Plectonema radiosum]MCV3216202.1 hypothetical protein [Plectonema radiosum NIES-515]